MIILEVTKDQDFTLYLEDTFLKEPHWGQIAPLSLLIRVNAA